MNKKNDYIVSENVSTIFLTERQVVNKLFYHANSLDLALVDTSISQPYINSKKKSREERSIAGEILGIANYDGITWKEGIEYSSAFEEYVRSHKNIKTIDEIVNNEMGFNGKYNSKIVNSIKKQTKSVQKFFKTRILEYSLEEKENYMKVKDRLNFLKEEHELSEVDYFLLCSSINSGAFYESVGMFSNDFQLLRALKRFNKNLKWRIEGDFEVPINIVKGYTLIPIDYFLSRE